MAKSRAANVGYAGLVFLLIMGSGSCRGSAVDPIPAVTVDGAFYQLTQESFSYAPNVATPCRLYLHMKRSVFEL